MQAVVLAAGRGTRMDELTTAVPKPMLTVSGKPLLEYKLDALPDSIDEVVLIVGYLGNKIRQHFGALYGGKRVVYAEQEKMDGTAGALWRAAPLLHDRFLIMMGDDIYMKEDVERCLEDTPSWKLLVQELPVMGRAGNVQLGQDGLISAIIESKEEDAVRTDPGIASTNLYVLDTRLFSQPLLPKHEGSLEYGLPQTVVAAAHTLGVSLEPIFTDKWIQITAPKDLITAEQILKETST